MSGANVGASSSLEGRGAPLEGRKLSYAELEAACRKLQELNVTLTQHLNEQINERNARSDLLVQFEAAYTSLFDGHLYNTDQYYRLQQSEQALRSKWEESAKEVRELRKAAAHYQSLLEQQESEHVQREEQLEAKFREETNALTSAKQALTSQLRLHEEDIARLEKEIKNLKREVEAAAQKQTALEGVIARTEDEVKRERRRADDAAARVDSTLGQADGAVAKAREECEGRVKAAEYSCAQRIKKMEADCYEKDRLIAELKAQRSRFEEEQRRNELRFQEVQREMERIIEQWQTKASQESEAHERTKADVAKLRERKGRMETQGKNDAEQIARLESQVQILTEREKAREEQLRKFSGHQKKKDEERARQGQEVHDLQEMIKELRDVNRDFEQKNQELVRKNEKLKQENQDWTNKHKNWADGHSPCRLELAEMKLGYEKELITMRMKLDQHERRAEKYRRKYDRARQGCSTNTGSAQLLPVQAQHLASMQSPIAQPSPALPNSANAARPPVYPQTQSQQRHSPLPPPAHQSQLSQQPQHSEPPARHQPHHKQEHQPQHHSPEAPFFVGVSTTSLPLAAAAFKEGNVAVSPGQSTLYEMLSMPPTPAFLGNTAQSPSVAQQTPDGEMPTVAAMPPLLSAELSPLHITSQRRNQNDDNPTLEDSTPAVTGKMRARPEQLNDLELSNSFPAGFGGMVGPSEVCVEGPSRRSQPHAVQMHANTPSAQSQPAATQTTQCLSKGLPVREERRQRKLSDQLHSICKSMEQARKEDFSDEEDDEEEESEYEEEGHSDDSSENSSH